MTDPRRMLDDALGDDGGDAAALLRSARFDSPSDDARNRAAIALGIAGGTALGTMAASAGASGAVGAAGAGKVGAIGGGAMLFKWIGVGVAGAFLAVTAVKLVVPHDAGDRDAVRPASSVAAPARDPFAVIPPPRPIATISTPSAAPSVAPIAPSNAQQAGSARTAVSASASPSARPLSIADEIALLDKARTALADGDTASALRILDAHDRAFPNGALGPEASVLRIDALADAGDETNARAEAKRFLAAHPNGPQSRHVRSRIDRMTIP